MNTGFDALSRTMPPMTRLKSSTFGNAPRRFTYPSSAYWRASGDRVAGGLRARDFAAVGMRRIINATRSGRSGPQAVEDPSRSGTQYLRAADHRDPVHEPH